MYFSQSYTSYGRRGSFFSYEMVPFDAVLSASAHWYPAMLRPLLGQTIEENWNKKSDEN